MIKKTDFILMSAVVAAVSVWVSGALASVPKQGAITNDTALYQNLSDIKAARELSPNFDSDIAHLTVQERRYMEALPSLSRHPRMTAPIQRISQQKYQYAPKKAAPQTTLR